MLGYYLLEDLNELGGRSMSKPVEVGGRRTEDGGRRNCTVRKEEQRGQWEVDILTRIWDASVISTPP